MKRVALLLLLMSSMPPRAAGGAPAFASPARSIDERPLQGGAADPESASVRLGRRPGAPWVTRPFTGGARSLDDLGRRICRALVVNAQDSLLALCITEDEFRDILWREFPASRPATGLTWQDGWLALGNRFRAGAHGAIREWGDQRLTFVRWEGPRGVMRYRNFTLHSGLALVARDLEGRPVRIPWVRSIAERKGRFKIYSTTD